MAGYSGTPLPKKLGIKAGHRVAWVRAPRGFEGTLGPLPEKVVVSPRVAGKRPFDVILVFVSSRADLEQGLSRWIAGLAANGGLWIAWPKKASGVATDVTEDTIRKLVLPRGLVDNKVCAIDETWSGLRCVIRLVNRTK